MRAIEKRAEVRSAGARLKAAFSDGAERIGRLSGLDVYWHERLGIWGAFGATPGRGGVPRAWNPFGQKPHDFRSNMIVEINPPNRGIDQNLQGLFAVTDDGQRWLLHQGRMSVAGSRVTEADFIAATGLQPVAVDFSEGPKGQYHPVAALDAPPMAVQESIAAFVARCAQARLYKMGGAARLATPDALSAWEHGLRPEATGDIIIPPREAALRRRRHAHVWKALAAELKRRKTPHSNDRLGQYGPDLFTYGAGPAVLFEIKCYPGAQDVFAAVGQLQIYERLSGKSYRKVLVVPRGVSKNLQGPLRALDIRLLEYDRVGVRVRFDARALAACLKDNSDAG
ncbi:MAG: hypothetical protein ACI8U3_002143 [Brevundimonas sp.]|jgi:hypothetical protein|uniref:hypothetical protein n=1 Tax=Brevundimonas sp. TaxID=1871086 RepID=UPI0039E3EDB1